MSLPAAVVEWRKARRAELLARREAVPADVRHEWNDAVTRLLNEGFGVLDRLSVGFCWPFKAEYDARFFIHELRKRGAKAALPVVVAKKAPLEFREWWPGVKTVPGVFDLPVPQNTEIVLPDALLIPPVGFGPQGYRLGYGGGYFDRTLAARSPQPLKIGVAFEISRMATIDPQPHDIPMDFIVTERGVHRPGGGVLQLVESMQAVREAVAELLRQRGITVPEAQPAAGDGAAAMPQRELLALLDALLEAERAGAKVLAAFLDEYETDREAWRELRRVQRDEAHNCVILIELIRGIGGTPSTATGDFLGKAMAVQGRAERLRFLNRGQGWVARKIRESLPRIEPAGVHAALQRMLDSHVANIEACQVLVDARLESH